MGVPAQWFASQAYSSAVGCLLQFALFLCRLLAFYTASSGRRLKSSKRAKQLCSFPRRHLTRKNVTEGAKKSRYSEVTTFMKFIENYIPLIALCKASGSLKAAIPNKAITAIVITKAIMFITNPMIASTRPVFKVL